MTVAFDMASRLPAAAGNHAGGRADWRRLRARLAAAYAVHAALDRAKPRPAAIVGGSFDCRSARVLAVFGTARLVELDGINPSALGNGKLVRDNHAGVAGASVAGG